MPTTQDIKRKQAASFIEEVLKLAYDLEEGTYPKDRPIDVANRLRTIASIHGLQLPATCTGEAHNPKVAGQIDHCGSCMPNWGVCIRPVKVK